MFKFFNSNKSATEDSVIEAKTRYNRAERRAAAADKVANAAFGVGTTTAVGATLVRDHATTTKMPRKERKKEIDVSNKLAYVSLVSFGLGAAAKVVASVENPLPIYIPSEEDYYQDSFTADAEEPVEEESIQTPEPAKPEATTAPESTQKPEVSTTAASTNATQTLSEPDKKPEAPVVADLNANPQKVTEQNAQ